MFASILQTFVAICAVFAMAISAFGILLVAYRWISADLFGRRLKIDWRGKGNRLGYTGELCVSGRGFRTLFWRERMALFQRVGRGTACRLLVGDTALGLGAAGTGNLARPCNLTDEFGGLAVVAALFPEAAW